MLPVPSPNLLQGVFELYAHQRRYLQDPSPYKIALFARQCGKSYVAGLELMWEMIHAASSGTKARFLVLSLSRRHAQIMLQETLLSHFDALSNRLSKHLSHPPAAALHQLLSGLHYRGDSLQLGCATLCALPATVDAARGYSGHVLLDEFAFHPHSEKLWAAVFPVVSHGFRLRILSTPSGRQGQFYHLCQAALKTQNEAQGQDQTQESALPWRLHRCTLYQAIAGGLPRDPNLLRQGIGTPEAFAREYELSFDIKGAKAFDSRKLQSALSDEKPLFDKRSPCFVGVDIARRGDYFVIWVLSKEKEHFQTRQIIAHQHISFLEQERYLDEVMRTYPVYKVCMDQSGMGEKPVEDAKRRYGHKIQGLRFHAALKRRLVMQARALLDRPKALHLPNEPRVRQAFEAIEEHPHPELGALYKTRRDVHGHGDLAWACMMAIDAALGEEPHTKLHYETLQSKAKTDLGQRSFL